MVGGSFSPGRITLFWTEEEVEACLKRIIGCDVLAVSSKRGNPQQTGTFIYPTSITITHLIETEWSGKVTTASFKRTYDL